MANQLFTVEQIELIRRLRNSGVTREQILLAFDQLDRLDVDLGRNNLTSSHSSAPSTFSPYQAGSMLSEGLGSMSVGQLLNANTTSTCQLAESVSHLSNGVSSTHRPDAAASSCSSMHPSTKPVEPSLSSQSYSQPQGISTVSSDNLHDGNVHQNGELSPTTPVSSASSASRLPSELTIIPLATSTGILQTEQKTVQSGMGSYSRSSSSIPVQCLVDPHDLLENECSELENFKKKGEEAMLAEIRNFVMRYNLKQTMIAEMTRLSQAYVSRFFRGDTLEMSDRTKNTFYMWYLTCKNNPWKLPQLCPSSGVKRMVSDNGDLIPLKRERFTFKTSHLAVLERYYEQDPYPDAQTREEIVKECNRAVGRPDRPVLEREKVTLPVVNNWFNNRRKEAKKQLRQQHASAIAVSSGNIMPFNQPYSLTFPSMASLGWTSSSDSSVLASSSFPLPVSQPNISMLNASTSPLTNLGGAPPQVQLSLEPPDSDISQESSEPCESNGTLSMDLGSSYPTVKQETDSM